MNAHPQQIVWQVLPASTQVMVQASYVCVRKVTQEMVETLEMAALVRNLPLRLIYYIICMTKKYSLNLGVRPTLISM